MNKKTDPKSQLARLPDGQKVRIESHEGDTVVVRRVEKKASSASQLSTRTGALILSSRLRR